MVGRSLIVRGLLASCAVVLAACGGHAAGASSTGPTSSGASPSGSSQSDPATGAAQGRPGSSRAESDWPGFDFNARRSGVGPPRTGISAGGVKRLKLRPVQVDGTVDSSAIELHGVRTGSRVRDVAIVTTTYGRTIALDPASGRRLWEFVPADIGRYEGSAQITTATPIADPDRRFVYAASPDGRIHKLLVASGREIRSGGWPTRVTFDATHEKIASALNISGRSVVVVTGGYLGDAPPYQGHVVMISRSSGQVTAVWNSLCSNRPHLIDPPRSCRASDSAIWARSGAVIEPGSGRMLVATGNAPFNGVTDWGDSVLELSPDGRRLLHNWTPSNQAQLNGSDGDIGSTAPALLPKFHGRRLAVQGGKDGLLRLLDLDRLDGTRGKAGPRLGGELQQIAAPGRSDVFTAPVVWSHAGHPWMFVAGGSGTAAYVLSGSRPRLHVAWQSKVAGTSPVLAGGLLYVFDPGGSLHAFEPASGRELISLRAGSGHWNSPIVDGGRVILPVGNANDHATRGTIDIYHLPGH
jgi:outer membrane protein assembly factor BamB